MLARIVEFPEIAEPGARNYIVLVGIAAGATIGVITLLSAVWYTQAPQ